MSYRPVQSAGPGLIVLWVTKWHEDPRGDCFFTTRRQAEAEVEYYRDHPEWKVELGPVRREVHPREKLSTLDWDSDLD